MATSTDDQPVKPLTELLPTLTPHQQTLAMLAALQVRIETLTTRASTLVALGTMLVLLAVLMLCSLVGLLAELSH